MATSTNNSEFSTGFVALIQQFHNGTLTASSFTTQLLALVDDWDAITPAQLASGVTTFVGNQRVWQKELRDWWSGTISGGWNSTGTVVGGGYYPFTSDLGVTSYAPCPALVANPIVGPAGQAANAAVIAQDAANTAVAAGASITAAKVAAELANTNANASRLAAAGSATTAAANAVIATAKASEASNSATSAASANASTWVAKAATDTAKTAAELANTNANTSKLATAGSATTALANAVIATAKALEASNSATSATTANASTWSAKGLTDVAKTSAEVANTSAWVAKVLSETARTGSEAANTAANASKLAAAGSAATSAANAVIAITKAAEASASANAAANSATLAAAVANAASYQLRLEKGAVNGYAGLDSTGKVPAANLDLSWTAVTSKPTTFTPSTHTHVIADVTGLQTALDAKLPLANAVTAVAGRTGVVTLAKSDVGLNLVDNTADTAKPISNATQTALNLKLNTSSKSTNAQGLAGTDNVTWTTPLVVANAIANTVTSLGLRNVVKTVNGAAPDATGAITLEAGGGLSVGDILYTLATPDPAEYLPSDGRTLAKSSYANAAAAVGSIPNATSSLWSTYQMGFGVDGGFDIAYGNGIGVAVSRRGRTAVTTDGVNWTYSVGYDSNNGGGFLCFGNGVWVLSRVDGVVYTSPDGLVWTNRGSKFPNSGNPPKITYNGSIFLALAAQHLFSVVYWTSTDGITWTQRNSTGATIAQYCEAVGTRFFATGKTQPDPEDPGVVYYQAVYSDDGINWTLCSTLTGMNSLVSSIGGSGSTVIIADGSGCWISYDFGLSWVRRVTGNTGRPSIHFMTNCLVICGQSNMAISYDNGATFALNNVTASFSVTYIVKSPRANTLTFITDTWAGAYTIVGLWSPFGYDTATSFALPNLTSNTLTLSNQPGKTIKPYIKVA